MKRALIVLLIIGVLLIGGLNFVDAKTDKKDSSTSSDSISISLSNPDSSSDAEDLDNSKTNNGQDKTSDSDSSDSEISSGKKIKEEKTITLLDENQNQYQVTVRTETKNQGEESQIKIKVRNVEINSDVEIEQDGDLLKAKLSNGNKEEIKIMPDTASKIAIEKLQMKGIDVQLKEVGEGNDLSVVYEAEGNKSVKFLGLFKVRTQVRAMISAENGEVLRLEKPWWYFLAFGKGAVDCDEDNLDLCDDEAECSEAGLIWFEDNCISGCPEDVIICEDESVVYRNPELNCEFDECPVIIIEEPEINETEINESES